jgi:hypothetical protein
MVSHVYFMNVYRIKSQRKPPIHAWFNPEVDADDSFSLSAGNPLSTLGPIGAANGCPKIG